MRFHTDMRLSMRINRTHICAYETAWPALIVTSTVEYIIHYYYTATRRVSYCWWSWTIHVFIATSESEFYKHFQNFKIQPKPTKRIGAWACTPMCIPHSADFSKYYLSSTRKCRKVCILRGGLESCKLYSILFHKDQELQRSLYNQGLRKEFWRIWKTKLLIF